MKLYQKLIGIMFLGLFAGAAYAQTLKQSGATVLSAQLGCSALSVYCSQKHFLSKMVHKGSVSGLTWRF